MTISFNMCFIASFFTHSSKIVIISTLKTSNIIGKIICADIKHYNVRAKVHYILYSIRATRFYNDF